MLARPAVLIALLFALATGCNALPPGDPARLRSPDAPAAADASAAPVLLLRGWRDLWSDGIDRLAARLRADGIRAAVFKQSQSGEVGGALVDRAKANRLGEPVVLIGFSFGADDSIRNAARLGDAGHPVDLLILIDPVTPPPIPPNVRRCVNFYQSNGAWDVFPWLRGVPVKADPADPQRVTNVDLRGRPDLLEPDTAHKTIAANPKLHAAIVAEVRRAVPTAGGSQP